MSYGILDYTGKEKPILSVDRIKIIQYPKNNDVILKTIEYVFRQKYHELVKKHANQYHLDNKTISVLESLDLWHSDFQPEEDTSIIRHLRI